MFTTRRNVWKRNLKRETGRVSRCFPSTVHTETQLKSCCGQTNSPCRTFHCACDRLFSLPLPPVRHSVSGGQNVRLSSQPLGERRCSALKELCGGALKPEQVPHTQSVVRNAEIGTHKLSVAGYSRLGRLLTKRISKVCNAILAGKLTR